MGVSTRGREIPGQHLEGCCLSGSVHAEQSKTFSLRYAKAQPIYGQVTTLFTGLVNLKRDNIWILTQFVGGVETLKQMVTLNTNTSVTLVRFSRRRRSRRPLPLRTRFLSFATSWSSSGGAIYGFSGRRRGLMKNLNSHSNVMMKKPRPIAAIATKFLDTSSHSNGDLSLLNWPKFIKTTFEKILWNFFHS